MRNRLSIRVAALLGALLLSSAGLPARAAEAGGSGSAPASEGGALPEKILGYRVIQPTKEELGTLGEDLSRFINVSAVRFGEFSEDVLNLEVYVQFLKESPVLGKVHMIEFRKLSLNGVRFQIEGFRNIKIPKEGPYESDQPIRISARYADVDLNALRTFLAEDLTFHVQGQVWTFGKFKVGKKKGKFCIPIAIDLTVPAQDLAGNEKYEQVASVIRSLVKANIVGGLGEALRQVQEEEAAEAAEAAEGEAPAAGAESTEAAEGEAPADGAPEEGASAGDEAPPAGAAEEGAATETGSPDQR